MTVAVEDIRLCTVRTADDAERRFCFEVISPGKSFLLQGDSDEVREAWISAIQVGSFMRHQYMYISRRNN